MCGIAGILFKEKNNPDWALPVVNNMLERNFQKKDKMVIPTPINEWLWGALCLEMWFLKHID